MPTIELVDLRKTKLAPEHLVTEPLREEIEKCLANGNQCIIYLGRRGYANIVLCEDCGSRVICKHCDIPLTYYRRRDQLLCHICGFHSKVPTICPTCKHEELSFLGGGTEALETELKTLFPSATVDRLDRSVVTSQKRLQSVVDRMNSKETSILIGTQMITKGYDFPNVTVVCVILADLSLFNPDFRALEKSLQLLSQVAGRAGRGTVEGKVLIQTYNPDHPLFKFLIDHDQTGFMDVEMESRERFFYPPYSYLVDVRSEGKNEQGVLRSLQHAADLIKKRHANIEVLGPAPENVSKVKDMYRFHFIIKAKSRSQAQNAAHDLEKFETEHRLVLDIDPY